MVLRRSEYIYGNGLHKRFSDWQKLMSLYLSLLTPCTWKSKIDCMLVYTLRFTRKAYTFVYKLMLNKYTNKWSFHLLPTLPFSSYFDDWMMLLFERLKIHMIPRYLLNKYASSEQIIQELTLDFCTCSFTDISHFLYSYFFHAEYFSRCIAFCDCPSGHTSSGIKINSFSRLDWSILIQYSKVAISCGCYVSWISWTVKYVKLTY